MGRPRYRQLAHTADCRLLIWGADRDELVGNAVAAAVAVALGRAPGGPPTGWRHLPSQRAFSQALVAAINEALFLLYSRREATVAVARRRGRLCLGTRPLAPRRGPAIEVKAATFHDLAAARRGSRLRAVLTLDL